MLREERVELTTTNDTGKTIQIKCNKCKTWVVAHKWSISGGGKKCNCGNMLYRQGSSELYFAKKG